ncbi:RBBP9/YdeN family alpha/beta hydrolase [Nocardioides humi]|uniref:Alpha/beta hydrolase n=1 Tax=Nocardioides humi TaxID=449461 RepID=A0ABN2AGT6_9ACTN|nr:alpha/beta hydrolase [Nocardioides humi]
MQAPDAVEFPRQISLPSQPLVIVPGIDDSPPGHWQSLWQAAHPDARRIAPQSFIQPDLSDWVQAVDEAVNSATSRPLLIAHSLGCLAAIAWAIEGNVDDVAALFLAAVPDPSGPSFPGAAQSFREVRARELGVGSLVVASENDPYGEIAYAQGVARALAGQFRAVGRQGHINESSGVGLWPVGQALLADLAADLT